MMKKEHELVNINEASIQELTSIKGIGASLAERIIDHRPYALLNDLINVSGISEVKLASLLPYLTIDKTMKKTSPKYSINSKEPITTIGNTEAFVFLVDQNERQDALRIILSGFILGLIILFLRRSSK